MNINKLANDFQYIKAQVTKGVIPFDNDLLTAIIYFKLLSSCPNIIDSAWHSSSLKLLTAYAHQNLTILESFAYAREMEVDLKTVNNSINYYLKTVGYVQWFEDMTTLCKDDECFEGFVYLFKKCSTPQNNRD